MNWAQIVINGLITASELGIIAIGLTMTFSVLRFGNFAHTETAVLGAYIAFSFNVWLHWNLLAAMLVAAALVGPVGIAVARRSVRGKRDSGAGTTSSASAGPA